MQLFKRLLLALLLLLVVGYGFICWQLSNRILEPHSSLERTKSRIESQWGSTYEKMLANLPTPQDFSINSFDGTALKGKYFQRSDSSYGVVILAHGWTSTWAGMLKYVPVLSDCNCDLILYDHRAHGESGGAYPTGGINEAKDLLALTEWVKEEKGFSADRVGWLGASWGGATVLTAGADEKDVAFIIADAPFQDWYSAIFERGVRDYGSWVEGLSAGVMGVVNWRADIDMEKASSITVADQIEEPVLLIHSQSDSETASSQSVNIAKKLNANSTFHHLDWGADHTHDVRINKARFQGLINAFLMQHAPSFLKGEAGFESLFNGKNLDAWVGNKLSYTVDEGTILVDPEGGKGGGNLYTEKEYSNFILRFEFQLTPGANNGLGIHAPLEGDAAYVGKELQILDNTAEKYANLQPYQYHGSVYGIIPAKRGFQKPVGEWNMQEVQVQGPDIKVILNGTAIVDGNLDEATKYGTMDKKEHPGLKRNTGHIGFLGHGDVLRFRNIRIKEL